MVEWIKKMWEKYQDIFWYCFFGGLTTIVNLVIFYLASNTLALHYSIANVIAWIVAVLFAYITNRIWVFKSKVKGFKNILREITTFFGFRVLSLLMEMAIMFVFIDLLGISEMITKVVTQVIVVAANYVFSKWIIFKKPEKDTEAVENEV